MAIANVALTARNNADWTRQFVILSGAGVQTPFRNVGAWNGSGTYQSKAPASVVTYRGDLYVARPTNTPDTWTETGSFGLARWQLLLSAAAFNGIPFDLTGWTLRMGVDLGSKGLTVLSTENGCIELPDPANGVWRFRVPTVKSEAFPAGTYPFDLVLIKDGARRTAMKGTLTVEEGQAP